MAISGVAVLLLALVARASAALCAGAWSTCKNGACALTPDACNQCTSGQYACPLSKSCFASPTSFGSCPNLKGTHYDSTLSVEARLDYIFAQQLTVAELVSQMTDNATQIPRLAIPAYVWLNDDRECDLGFHTHPTSLHRNTVIRRVNY